MLREHLQKLRTREQQSGDYLAQMVAETSKLNTIINEADKEAQRQRKECEVVVNERDILGTQLIRRNEELGLLYEKIRIQRSTLIKGELQYIERVREISTLKRRIRELAAEMGGLKGSVGGSQSARTSRTHPRAAASHRAHRLPLHPDPPLSLPHSPHSRQQRPPAPPPLSLTAGARLAVQARSEPFAMKSTSCRGSCCKSARRCAHM